jgi:thiamine biosynthesis protein ThiS
MRATINGAVLDLPDGLTVGMLLEKLGTAATGVAVARNDAVVPRSQYDSVRVGDGDRVEIIRAVAGG